MTYRDSIEETLAAAGLIGVSARGVEAFMRDERGTLDSLSPSAFTALAIDCAAAVLADPVLADRLADSMGVAA